MADALDDGGFWLPSQFLSDEDWVLEKDSIDRKLDNSNSKIDNNQMGFNKDVFGLPYDFPCGLASYNLSSDLSSPVESVSTETESDEDDYGYLAGLNRQMARSTLHDVSLGHDNAKSWAKTVSRSPQSTLCPVGTGCGCKPVTSRGSPNGCSKLCPSSPQATWELLYAAAGEVAKMKLDEEVPDNAYGAHPGHGSAFLGTTRKHIALNPEPTASFPLDLALYHKIQALEFQQLRQQQLLKQQQQGVAWGHGGTTRGAQFYHQAHPHHHHGFGGRRLNGENCGRGGLGLSGPAWPSLTQAQQQQKQGGSGMRAVFLGNPLPKRERAGTGVFLPRRVGTPTADTRKKSGCSTVLLPARVVQALNLNLDDMSGPQQLHPRFPADNDADDLRLRSGDFLGASHAKRGFRSQPSVIGSEIRLPQEWTY